MYIHTPMSLHKTKPQVTKWRHPEPPLSADQNQIWRLQVDIGAPKNKIKKSGLSPAVTESSRNPPYELRRRGLSQIYSSATTYNVTISFQDATIPTWRWFACG